MYTVLGYVFIACLLAIWAKNACKTDEIENLNNKLKLEEESHKETKKYFENKIREMQSEFKEVKKEKIKIIDDLMGMMGLSAE